MRKLRNLSTSVPRRVRRRFGAVFVVGMTLALTGCGIFDDKPLSTMDPESPIARQLDTFLVWLLIVCGVVFVIVQGMVIYMAKRFGVKGSDEDTEAADYNPYNDEEFPEQIHGNTRLEILWTLIPTVIMAVVAVFTVNLLVQLDDVSATENDRQRIESVTVVGQQWWWEFQYTLTDGEGPGPHIVTANELVLPEDEEIQLYVTSRDVIHSFWVPTLNGKRDAVPGRINEWTIEAGNIGRFPGECTEFCGLSHSNMEKFAVGVSPADFDLWVANQLEDAEVPRDAEALAGWEVFANQCASCHVINGLTSHNEGDGTDTYDLYAPGPDGLPVQYITDNQVQVAGVAPNLTHFASRSSFAGGIFELYEDPDAGPYIDISTTRLNRGALEAWILNAPEEKANAWDAPNGARGMTPFVGQLSAEQVDNLVAFLMTLD